MRENMSFFGCDFDKLVVCLVSDNCSTNRKISTDCGKPLVGCLNHKLNLQVNNMVGRISDLNKQLESVHKTMLAAKTLKSAAVLRNLTDLHPVVPNATRWSGKSQMLTRYIRIREDLLKASRDENASITMDRSAQFLSKVSKSQAMLAEINAVTKQLQCRYRTLSDCRGDIKILQGKIEEAVEKPDRKMYGCKLGDDYLRPNSHLTTDPAFESGFVKLQEGEARNLTQSEKNAVKVLKKEIGSTAVESSSDDDAPMTEALQKRRKFDDNEL